MKSLIGKKNKRGKITKGTSSAVILSIAIHAGLFLLAGTLVVFTVVKKKEVEFEPPKAVERPKMKLKKPKVKVKKTSRPKPTTRIVTKVKRASMPDIQLPEMSGMGDGLSGEMGGFEMMPDFELVSPFGAKLSTGSDLKGFFYNFNRDRSGRKIPMTPGQMEGKIHGFLKSGWNTSKIARYYRSPTPIYTPTICVPTVMSELAPQAFGEKTAEGYCWAVIYEGQLVYPEDITFRFWGVGDKLMAVRVGGETVLICAYTERVRSRFSTIWQSTDPKDSTYYFAECRARPSDWITLKAGEPMDLKVLMADLEGGLVYHMLSVEVQGEEYPSTRAGGGPTFPVFRTEEIPSATMDRIYSNLYPGDTCLTNGPIFRDYLANGRSNSNLLERTAVEDVETTQLPSDEETGQMRVWTHVSGEKMEAQLQVRVGRMVVLANKRKKQIKIPLDQLSPADREFVELEIPPDFDINFLKSSSQIPNPPTAPWSSGLQRPLQMFNYTFGVQVKQASVAKVYNHELVVEYFAIGEEVDGDNYVLLERNKSSFIPSEYRSDVFEFRGKNVELRRMAYRSSAPMRGTKYGGFLVIITDKRGKIIDYKVSHKFLFENFENLKRLVPNNHFNKKAERVLPARPNEDSRGPGALRGS